LAGELLDLRNDFAIAFTQLDEGMVQIEHRFSHLLAGIVVLGRSADAVSRDL
jgi:hypothetical protein